MKKLVKVLAVVLAATMLFALAACGSNPVGDYKIEKVTYKTADEEETIDFTVMTQEQRALHYMYGDLKIAEGKITSYDLAGNELASNEYMVMGNKLGLYNVPESEVGDIDITFTRKRVTIVDVFSVDGVETTVTTVYVRK